MITRILPSRISMLLVLFTRTRWSAFRHPWLQASTEYRIVAQLPSWQLFIPAVGLHREIGILPPPGESIGTLFKYSEVNSSLISIVIKPLQKIEHE